MGAISIGSGVTLDDVGAEITTLQAATTAAQTSADAAGVLALAAFNQQQPIAKKIGVNTNSISDIIINGIASTTKWIPEAIYITNASASLATSIMAASIRTDAGGAGTAVVAAVGPLTGLTAAAKFASMTIAALTDILTGPSLFFNITTASGIVCTVDVYVYGRVLEPNNGG